MRDLCLVLCSHLPFHWAGQVSICFVSLMLSKIIVSLLLGYYIVNLCYYNYILFIEGIMIIMIVIFFLFCFKSVSIPFIYHGKIHRHPDLKQSHPAPQSLLHAQVQFRRDKCQRSQQHCLCHFGLRISCPGICCGPIGAQHPLGLYCGAGVTRLSRPPHFHLP